MKHIVIILTIFLLPFQVAFMVTAHANDEQQTIQNQFVDHYTSYSDDDLTTQVFSSMQEDGTWSDIDYTSKQRGGWPTLNHLKRLVSMASSYADGESIYFKNTSLRASILKGLTHWLDKNYTNPNWWQPKIGIPENMAITLILLGDDLPDEVLKRAQMGPLKRTKIGMTGQNKVWLSGIAFMKGHLANDKALMKKASASIWEELVVSTKEGIQPDWSFHQHGPQQQFGNYGLSFGNRMIMWAGILNGTQYALKGHKLDILRNYQLQGASWVYWKGMLDFSACGRQLEEGSQYKKGQGLAEQLKAMQVIDPEYKRSYQKRLVQKNKLKGHKSFWRSEMAIHRTEDWYCSVKMSSIRTIGAETCNSENMLGLHEGDGTLLLYKTGKEYEDIIPVWDWHRLPGTTCDQRYGDLTPLSWNKGYGNSNFAGVLGDKKTGLAAMIYKRANLTAKKAYFFSDDEIVCLGTDISGRTNGNVFTSIQQAWLSDDLQCSKQIHQNEKTDLQVGDWIFHNGFGYYLMSRATLQTQTQKGNWNQCYPDRGNKPATGDVFSLWINHGKSPDKANYAYIICPNTSPKKMGQNKIKAKIISNTRSVQAVETKGSIKAVFYDANLLTLRNGRSIKVDAPCLLMLNKNCIFVSDPTHQSSMINISIDDKTHRVNLPQGDEKGKAVSIIL